MPEGTYSLAVSEGSTLVFSFIGLMAVKIPVGERTIVDARMSQHVQQLGEVIVTASGIERQTRALGYSVANASGLNIFVMEDRGIIKLQHSRIPL